MKKFLLSIGVVLMSIIAYASIGQSKTAVSGKAVVKMTYVDYDYPDAAAGEVATAVAGYNKISGGTVAMANTEWGVNKTIYLQVDLSGIKADRNFKKITLTAECSGSTDSKRATSWGVGYNTSTWSENLTYNTADRTITLCGETVSTITKSGSSFETFSWDITDAFAGGEKVATILVYETAAAGGNFKNPTVTVEEEPAPTPSDPYFYATFDFSTDEGLAALGIEKPVSGSGTNITGMTLKNDVVSMTSTDGTNPCRVWNNAGATDLRMYKSGGSFTISVPTGYKIISIDLAGAACNYFAENDECGTCTKTQTVWDAPEGESVTSKTFTSTGTGKISTITVKYMAPQATVYYSQDYENGATADWSTQVGGRFDPEIGEDADGNHYLRAAAGTRTSNGTGIYSNAYSGKLAAGTPFTMTADIHLRSANGQNGVEFAVGAAGASYDFSKWKLTGTMTLNMKQVATGGTEQWILNDDTDNPITLPGTGALAGTNAADIYDAAPWYSIQLTWQDGLTLFSIKNKATGEVIVDKQQLKNNDSFASVGGVGQIWFSTSRYNAAFAIDNVVIRDIIDDDLPASAPNTLTAGKYEITATITANEGVDVPAEMQKYLGGYTAEGELTGDSLELVISTTEEGFILNGYEITGDAVVLNDAAEVVYGDKHFQLGDAEGNTTGKLAITKTGEREYALADGTIVYMGNVVGKVTGITFRMIDDPTTAINSVDTKAITAGKFLENGKLVILKNGVKYGVAGQVK